MKAHPITWFIFILLWFIVIVNGLALYFSWYWHLLWLDIPMHFFGGLLVGLTALWVAYISQKIKISDNYRTPNKVILIAFIATVVIGSLWEVFEFSVDTILVIAPTYDIPDTMSDIVFDIIGALVASVIFINWELYKKK